MVTQEIFEMIKKEEQLDCSYEEFLNYYNSLPDKTINYNYSFHTFDEEYKGHKIENPTKNNNALYYVLEVEGRTYLQNHKPYVSGYEPITEENKEEVLNEHINQIKEEINNSYKLQETINHFKNL